VTAAAKVPSASAFHRRFCLPTRAGRRALYLKGISTGDFEDALIALLGRDAGGLSASTIGRLKEAWSEEHVRWSKRDLSAKRYIYFRVDGIHVQARLEDTAQCLLIIIGATPEGRKELVGLTDGVRESAQSWRELLLDLKRRRLSIGPELAATPGYQGDVFSESAQLSFVLWVLGYLGCASIVNNAASAVPLPDVCWLRA
jgi:hypothetical protein